MDLTMIYEAPWRLHPAAALALYGLLLVARGLWFGFPGSKGLLHDRDALGWMRAFRAVIAGVCLVGLAIGWAAHLPWVIAISLGVLGEEMLETSFIIEALKRAPAHTRTDRNRCRVAFTTTTRQPSTVSPAGQ